MLRFWLQEPQEQAAFLAPTHEALRELRDATTARGDRLLVALAPPLFYVSSADRERWRGELMLRGVGPARPDFEAMPRALATILDQLDVPACELAPTLAQAEAAGELAYLRFNRHWTARGHELAAQAIQGCLAQLPAPSKPPAPPATPLEP
jgi:hypothetical protein